MFWKVKLVPKKQGKRETSVGVRNVRIKEESDSDNLKDSVFVSTKETSCRSSLHEFP